MKSKVIIKSFQNGIAVILNDEVPFEELLIEVGEKFRDSSRFFGNVKMVITFEGRELSDFEEREMIDIISMNSQVEISCVLEKNPEKNQIFLKAMNQFSESTDHNEGQFYKGNLKSGQVLETDYSIIILGDVNPGASVISKGNIVVLGTLYGTASAGCENGTNNFVAALDMQPTQLKIGNAVGKCGEKGNKWILRNRAVPKIAFADKGNIYIEPITKELLKDIPL